MHSRCCWPPESDSADASRRSFTSSQMAAAFRLASTRDPQVFARRRHAVDAQAVGDVLEDRLRERIRLLEHHADAAPQVDDVDGRGVDVLAVDMDGAFDPCAWHDVVHPVQRPQERRLAAPGRTDERGDLVRADPDRDLVEDAARPVVEIQLRDVDLGRHVRRDRRGGAGRRCDGARRRRRRQIHPFTIAKVGTANISCGLNATLPLPLVEPDRSEVGFSRNPDAPSHRPPLRYRHQAD